MRDVPIAAILLLTASVWAGPQDSEEPPLTTGVPVREITRTAVPPTIDGVMGVEEWAGALVIDDFRQVDPVEGGPPSEHTEVRLTFDADALYVVFRCFDRDPDRIVATQMKRDGSLGADDRISFIVGPFFDRRNGYLFEMNALGARVDSLVERNDRLFRDWDGIWYGKSTIDDEGWTAEFAIPVKTIAFNPNVTSWSFNGARFIRRRNESIRWASPSRDRSFDSFADAGVLEGIADLEIGAAIDFKPYGVMTGKRDHERDRNGVDVDAGFDVFWRVHPTTTLALTFNTDFAETEVDDRRVNLTRFPLFFPEKRDFFLQDAGIFSFGGINRNPLPFQSRRIGLGPDGREREILLGGKLTSRTGDLNVGLIDVQMKHDDDLGDKNLAVARASLNVLEQSTVGAIFTAGDPNTTDDNYLGGVDFNFRDSSWQAGDKTVEARAWVQRSDTPDAGSGQWAYGGRIEYPNDIINWRVGFSEIQEDFNAALGFVPRRGIREYFSNFRYRIRPQHQGIRRIDFGAGAFIVTDLDDEIESRSVDVNLLEIESEFGDVIEFDYSFDREVLTDSFEIIDGVVIPIDDYRFDRYSAEWSSSSGRPWNASIRYSGGDFYSGTRDQYRLSIAWRASAHFNVSGSFELNDIDLPEGDFITRLLAARINFLFTPDLTWSTFAQYDNQSDSIGVNSRIRWIVEPGNEVYFVFNQAIDRDGSSYAVRGTELTTKVGWTFRF